MKDVPDVNRVHSAHLIGIAGAAMTPLATILLQQGSRVTGSDLVDAAQLQVLRDLGARIWIGHDPSQLESSEVVIASAAVPDDNPEVRVARARGIPVMKHATALGALMRVRRGIAIAGTHGKSTTTALVAHLLETAGLSPTFHVGAELINYGLFGRLGGGQFLVAEADEFDRRFLEYDPEIAVVTYIEPDHLDYFGSFEAVIGAYQQFVGRVRAGGMVILNADDPIAISLPVDGRRRLTYGAAEGADWQVVGWEPRGLDGSRLALRDPGGRTHRFDLDVLGRHNAFNAAAAVAVAAEVGLHLEAIAAGLASFKGVRRRLEVIGTAAGVTVIDDYAHHPTEVRAGLNAVRAHWKQGVSTDDVGREGGGWHDVWLVYQPHTLHRTASLLAEFAGCFEAADHVIVTPAYMPAGRILATEGATGAQLVAAMEHPDARSLTPDEATATVAAEAQPGDVVVVMGAGDIWTIERPLLDAFVRRAETPSGASPPPPPTLSTREGDEPPPPRPGRFGVGEP